MKKKLLRVFIYLIATMTTQMVNAAEAQPRLHTDEILRLNDYQAVVEHTIDSAIQVCTIINQSKKPINAQVTITQLDGIENVYSLTPIIGSNTIKILSFFYQTMLKYHPTSQTVQLTFNRDGEKSYGYDMYGNPTYLITDNIRCNMDRPTTIVKFFQQ